MNEIKQMLLKAGFGRRVSAMPFAFTKGDISVRWGAGVRPRVQFDVGDIVVSTQDITQAKALAEALVDPSFMTACITFDWARPIVEFVLTKGAQ